MALTPVPVADAVLNGKIHALCGGVTEDTPGLIIAEGKVTFTSGDAYAANGVALDLSAVCPNKVLAVIPGLFNTEANSGAALVAAYVPASGGAPATGVLKLFGGAASAAPLAESTTTTLTDYKGRVLVIGY